MITFDAYIHIPTALDYGPVATQRVFWPVVLALTLPKLPELKSTVQARVRFEIRAVADQ